MSLLLLKVDSRSHPGDIRVLKDLKHAPQVRSSWILLELVGLLRGSLWPYLQRQILLWVQVWLGCFWFILSRWDYSWPGGLLWFCLRSPSTCLTLGYSFNGSIPCSLSNLTLLRRLCLLKNLLSGQFRISCVFISPWRAISWLHLHGNKLQLSGEFPDLGVLKDPNYLNACDNQITSQVPSTLPRSLLELSMRNNFHGNLPDNVGDLEFYRFWFQAS